MDYFFKLGIQKKVTRSEESNFKTLDILSQTAFQKVHKASFKPNIYKMLWVLLKIVHLKTEPWQVSGI